MKFNIYLTDMVTGEIQKRSITLKELEMYRHLTVSEFFQIQ